MNYQKYIEIKEKYGKHASWAIWSDELDTPTSNMEDVSFFDDKEIYCIKMMLLLSKNTKQHTLSFT